MLARLALALGLALLLTAASPPPPLGLSGFKPFALHPGVNRIAKFSEDGRDATIMLAWRDNGNAWGFNIYLVTLPNPNTSNPFGVVGIEKKTDAPFETITDAPHTGEDYIRAVMFGRGNLDGKEQTLLLIATRLWKDSVPEPAVTTFEIFRLADDGITGSTPDYFTPVRSFTSTAKYCNAYMALFQEMKIPLPKDYSGPQNKDGCI